MSEDFHPRDNVRQLRGKGGGTVDYLDVKDRIAWFRNEWPDGHIETYSVSLTDQIAVFKCEAVKVAGGEIHGRSTGHGSETPGDFKDYIEKAETKAIGRALAALGYGTQFLPDDGERIADAPVERPSRQQVQPRNTPQTQPAAQEQIKPAPRTNHIPKDAPMLTADQIIGEYRTKIDNAESYDALYKIAEELAAAGISDDGLKSAYRTKKAAFQSTN